MQRRSRRSGGFNIDRPTVSLPVSDTETGRLRFQLSSLIFHAFTARGGGGGGGKGSRCSLLFAVSSMERLFPSFVLGPQVFLPRAKGKQKTNYKDGHHVTLPTWLYIYIYRQHRPCIMGGNSSLDRQPSLLAIFFHRKVSYRENFESSLDHLRNDRKFVALRAFSVNFEPLFRVKVGRILLIFR